MCGIAGYINRRGASVDPSIIRNMADAVSHRGPDAEGYEFHGNVAFGHRRLAIIDLADSSQQPMTYVQNREYTIVFNGEIYNYLELRQELSASGKKFTTDSDTEVILAAYSLWGEGCVTRFNGMWAFALLDRSRNAIFCSRDRYGVKPFYYVENEQQFAFGSEIRQLLPLLSQRLVNLEKLNDFILTAAADHTNETFFAEVKKLPPGHNLIYDLADNSIEVEPYYQLEPNPRYQDLTANEAVNLYRSALTNSVALRLRADVPIGTCLSGGLDSSSVATLAASLHSQKASAPFHAITAVSEQANNDESAYAKQVVEFADLRWLTTRPTYDDFVASLPNVVEAQEEPFTSPSLTMQYFVMKTARDNQIPVLLDGQGGDETLLGYEKYYVAHFLTTLREKGLHAAFMAFRDASKNNANMSLTRASMYLAGSLFPRFRYFFYRWRNSYLKYKFGLPEHLKRFSKASVDEFTIQHLEISHTNLPLLLRYEDKNSMHHSVEARLPFLDYQTLELALSIPSEYKIQDGWTKWLLRKSMEHLLPSDITWRRNKLGFEAPEETWLRKHEQIMRTTIFSSPLIENICNMNKLKKKYPKLDNRTRWRLYSVALWERAFEVSL